jgi:hypothetical protein
MLHDRPLASLPAGRILRKKDHADAVSARLGQLDGAVRALLSKQRIGNLQQDACAVAQQRVIAGGAAMRQVVEDLQALLNNRVAFRALDLGHESHATRVALVGGVIQALPCRKSRVSHVGTSCELVAPTASSRVQRRKVRLEAGPMRVSKRTLNITAITRAGSISCAAGWPVLAHQEASTANSRVCSLMAYRSVMPAM